MKTPKTRKLTVYYGHTENTYRQIPIIRIGGNYLAAAGFKIGDKVLVTLEENTISITKRLPGETETGSAGEQPVKG